MTPEGRLLEVGSNLLATGSSTKTAVLDEVIPQGQAPEQPSRPTAATAQGQRGKESQMHQPTLEVFRWAKVQRG